MGGVRGVSLASRCPFCGQTEEVLEHLFIHCPKIGTCGLHCFPCLKADGFVPTWSKSC